MSFYSFEQEIAQLRETLFLFIPSAFKRMKESDTSYVSYISSKHAVKLLHKRIKEMHHFLKVFQLSEKITALRELSLSVNL